MHWCIKMKLRNRRRLTPICSVFGGIGWATLGTYLSAIALATEEAHFRHFQLPLPQALILCPYFGEI